MSDDDVLVRVDDVAKKFCRDLRQSLWYGVKDSAAALVPWSDPAAALGELRPGEFWANHGIQFELRRGECLGLIGPNGAGKTTLLKMLGQLIRPDRGQIEIHGSLGGLIALEAGFNPVLTGRENVEINGSILGISRRVIRDRLEEIVDFADIQDAIDAPVRTYSSGMRVRLGFAIAVCLIKPDVLLLDEVLAVGDAAFRAKCYNAVAKLREQTATIFVSHNMAMIATTASRGLVLDHGKVACQGTVVDAVSCYESLNLPPEAEGRQMLHDSIDEAELAVSAEKIDSGEAIEIAGVVRSNLDHPSVYFDIVWYGRGGEIVAHWNGIQNNSLFELKKGDNHCRCSIQHVNLVAGAYDLGIVIRCRRTSAVLVWSYKEHQINVARTHPSFCPYQMQ